MSPEWLKNLGQEVIGNPNKALPPRGSEASGSSWLRTALQEASTGITPEGEVYTTFPGHEEPQQAVQSRAVLPERQPVRRQQYAVPPSQRQIATIESPAETLIEGLNLGKMAGAYVVAPFLAVGNRLVRGLGVSPEEHLHQDTKEVILGTAGYSQIEKLPEDAGFINMLNTTAGALVDTIELPLSVDWKPDDDFSQISPTERRLAFMFADQIARGVDPEDPELLAQIEERVRQVNMGLAKGELWNMYVQQEQLRYAYDLAQVLKANKNRVLFEVRPAEALFASVLGAGGFSRAVGATLFKHEGKDRGIQVRLLQRSKHLGGNEIAVLAGGMGMGVDKLPVDSFIEWRQSQAQQVVSDTNFGRLLRAMLGFGGENVEIGSIIVRNPRAPKVDKVEIPLIVRAPELKSRLDSRSIFGGGEVLALGLRTVTQAVNIVDNLKKGPIRLTYPANSSASIVAAQSAALNKLAEGGARAGRVLHLAQEMVPRIEPAIRVEMQKAEDELQEYERAVDYLGNVRMYIGRIRSQKGYTNDEILSAQRKYVDQQTEDIRAAHKLRDDYLQKSGVKRGQGSWEGSIAWQEHQEKMRKHNQLGNRLGRAARNVIGVLREQLYL